MHSSTIIASLFAALAIAAPAHQQLHKKAYVYDIVTEIVTVTVTAGQEPETITLKKTVLVAPKTTKVRTTRSKTTSKTTTIATTTTTTTSVLPTTTTTTTPPPPPPAPTTTTLPPPPPAPTTTEAPIVVEPTTTEAPVVVVAPPTTEAPVQAEPTVAPVVESAPVVQSTSSTGNGVKDAALNAHNAYRAKHHAGSVTWDDSLASSAEALASGCTNKHGLIVGGQNIAAKGVSGSGEAADFMTGAVDSWYNEVDLFGSYYGQSQVTDTSVLHFTQVVWKATTKIGCAVSNCGTSSSFFPGFNAYTIVCNYQSAGNFAGQYAENVSAP